MKQFLLAPGTLLHLLFIIVVSTLGLAALQIVPADRTDIFFLGTGLILLELFFALRFARHERWEAENTERLRSHTDKALADALAMGNALTQRFIDAMEVQDSTFNGAMREIRSNTRRVEENERKAAEAHGRIDAVDRRLVHVEDHLRIRRDIRPASLPGEGG